MAKKFKCYQHSIKEIIGVGEENKCTLIDIISHRDFVINKEHLAVKDFNKAIRREIRTMIEDIGPDIETGEMILVEQKATIKGQQPYYFWLSSSLKNVNTGREEISSELRMARAIAFQFVDEYLKEFLPPNIIQNLEEDMDEAHSDLLSENFWQKKLQFHPSGFDLRPNPRITEGNSEDWRMVYDALNHSYVIQAHYPTLHTGLIPAVVKLSLQKIQYVNHKVLVLAYVHEVDVVKSFEVARLKKISKVSGLVFKNVNMVEYEQRYDFKARVNVFVKDYFSSVNFGHNFKAIKDQDNDSWIITTSIKVPEHFSKEKQGPDPFTIANFLGGFGDSIEVLEPAFLREEMRRRANNLVKLYAPEYDSASVINKSPHEQTGNYEALK